MKTGRITKLTTGKSPLELALQTLKNQAPGTTLVTHGWVKRCEVCERLTHAKWHEVAKNDINPVALIQFVERYRNATKVGGVITDIVAYVCGVTGIDEPRMRAMLESEQAVAAVDPQATDTGKPPTRV
jgi:hypothetical protein